MKEASSEDTAGWYAQYYREKGADRNSLLRNPEVVFQTLAADVALIDALRETAVDASAATVLDVGCGNGASLLNFLRLGFRAENLHGIELQDERLSEARHRLPACRFTCGDASAMPFATASFDVVTESTMFVQLTDVELSRRIAAEMIRVCRPGGYLVVADWRYGKPGNANYLAMNKRRLRQMFRIGTETAWRGQFRGSLVPPLGRTLSRFGRPLFFLTAALLPFTAGHVVTVLQKSGSGANRSEKGPR